MYIGDVCMYVCAYAYIYIYIYIHRERERYSQTTHMHLPPTPEVSGWSTYGSSLSRILLV